MDSRRLGLLLIFLCGVSLVAWNLRSIDFVSFQENVASELKDGIIKLAPGQSISHENMSRGFKKLLKPLTALGMNNSELSDHLVVFFGDEKQISKHGNYRMNRLFWECYGNKWGVLTRFFNPKDFTGCQHHRDWFMSRVCAMAVLVESLVRNVTASLGSLDPDLKGVRWIIHLDMDTIPTNLAKPLSAFTKAWDDHDLVFYERFHNGEITAGNYAVRVSETAANFLRGWESQAGLLNPKLWVSGNHDNGVLHIQVLNFLKGKLPSNDCWKNADDALESVVKAFKAVFTIHKYDAFVSRAKLALGPNRNFGKLLIQRRGLGFCADDVAPVFFDSKHSFCFHAIKSVDKALESLTRCLDLILRCSQPPTHCEKNKDYSLGEKLRGFHPERPALGQINDIKDCWPDCSQDISSSMWKTISTNLVNYAGC
eukprot:symbB.v1.2.016465.t1/scaffold1252.1/size200744/13